MMRRWLWVLVALGVLAGLYGAARRHRVEMRNRAVEIALDIEELREIALAQRLPLAEVLARVKASGATSVLVAEDTLGALEDAGGVGVALVNGETRVTFGDSELARRFEQAIAYRVELAEAVPSGDRQWRVQAPWTVLRDVGIGLPMSTVEAVRAAGLGVVGRVGAGRGGDAESTRLLLGQLASLGIATVVFTGDMLPGFPSAIDGTARAMREPAVGLNYGSVEFGKQRGDSGLVRMAPDRVVRVHAVTVSEMASATPQENIQRYSLAARERNIRVCFVRLFVDAPKPVDAAVGYLSAIRRSLGRAGMGAGPARPFEPLDAPAWLRAVCGAGVGAGFLLLIDCFVGCVRRRPLWLLGLLPFVLAAALPQSIGAKVVALVAGCVFPALGMVVFDLAKTTSGRPAAALRGLLLPSAITFCGVVMVVGLLSDRVFLVKGDAFAGVKLTLVVPIAVTASAYLLDLRRGDTDNFAEGLAELFAMVRRLWSTPVLVGQVVLAGSALVALAVVVWRSGNDPGVGISGWEVKLRALLDRILMVRPRFKDLIGHPALVIATGFLAGPQPMAGALLLCLGALGQASLLNTFCHLHTPLWVSAVRDLIGLALGGIVGLAVYSALFRSRNNAA